MKRIVTAFLLLAAAGLHAEENDVETKLRQALRDTMLKLRDAQGQVANAQAAQIAAETKIKELEGKNEQLGKDLVKERNTSSNMIAELNTKLDERAALITSLQASVEKWKQSYKGATEIAAKNAAEKYKFEARSQELERLVQSQQIKNIEMYKAAMETVDRYERFGLGDAALAREPFIATTRVKLQNAVQDQANRLADARITPAANAPGVKPANADSDAKPAKPQS